MNLRKLGAAFRHLVARVGASPKSQRADPAGPHHAVDLATEWFKAGREVTHLTRRWMDFEDIMLGDPEWAALSREERRFTPAQSHLAEIDGLKEHTQDRQHVLLEQLVTTPSVDLSGAVAKLSVAMGVIIPEDYPHCYRLIEDAVRTLGPLT